MSGRHEWAFDETARYGIYLGHPADFPPTVVTSKEGIGTALVALAEDGELDGDTRVGILDGFEDRWLVNPFASRHRRRPPIVL